MRELTYSQAINEAYDEEMKRDPSVFIMGEDIGQYWGAAFGEMQGLYAKYGPKRIRETPISETAILGSAIGAAATGMRPIAFLFFVDFLGVCWDEIWNQLTPMRYMFGGKAKLPVTITCYSGAGIANAAQHSKCGEGILMSIPGLKIITPSTPYDAKGLLKSAIREDNPTIYFVNKFLLLSALQGPVPEEDYTIPLGVADIKREGSDITIVATSSMVHIALGAAKLLEEYDISAEVVDPRTLWPLDERTLIESAKKTSRVIVMDEGYGRYGATAELASVIQEGAFFDLEAPVKRMGAMHVPIPFSPPLEDVTVPTEKTVLAAALALCGKD